MTGQPLTLGRGIRAAANRSPDKIALRCEGKELSYSELVDRANAAGNMLARRFQVSRGERVALIAPNCFQYVELMIAVSDLGAMTVAINPKLSGDDLASILMDCEASLIIVHENVPVALPASDTQTLVIADYEKALPEFDDGQVEDVSAEIEPFVIHYTSGTTGQPKGVMVSHRSRVLSFLGMASEYGCYGPDDHFLAVSPLCHGAGLAFALAPIYTGGTVTLTDQFAPVNIVSTLARKQITGVFFVPTHFQRIFELNEEELSPLRNHKLRALISNAAPLLQADKERVIAMFGEGVLFECYGATESGIITNLRPQFHLQKRDCVGSPFVATEVKLCDNDGAEIGEGQVGELFSRSPYLFSGYWKKPEETKQAWSDGWVSVGDLATRDSDGCYYIVGRKKDMIISGGMNIYPKRIEDVILKIPEIEEVAVVGLPDPKWGEIVHAEVVVKKGRTISGEEIADFCRKTLSSYSIPKSVSFASTLPRNVSGKVLKRVISDLRVRSRTAS